MTGIIDRVTIAGIDPIIFYPFYRIIIMYAFVFAEVERREREAETVLSMPVSFCPKKLPEKVFGRSCELEKPRGTFISFFPCSA